MADEKQTPVEPPKAKAGEYKFSDDEYKTSYDTSSGGYGAAEPVQKKGLNLPFKVNKRIVIVLILIVVVLIAYQFVAPKRIKQPQLPAQSQVVQQPVSTFSDSRITEVQQQLSNNSDAVNKLQDQFAKTQVGVSNLEDVLANLNSTVQHLAGEIEALKIAGRSSRVTHRIVKPKTSYHITAIVPGRAWLRSNHGLIVTVRLGSKLPEYGIIKSINSQSGVVTTSSGFSIRYGRYDT